MSNDRCHRRHSTRARRLLLGAAVCAVVLWPTGSPAQDAPDAPERMPEGAEFAVQPSGPEGPGDRDWFTYTLDPGAVFGDTVAISNLSDRPIRFALYPTDAESVADTAGFAALRDDETPTDVGTWIQLAADEYVVEPGKRIDVPFSISVPRDAEPGDHAGAILAIDADDGGFDPNAAPEGLSFDVRRRLGARVYVRVNGPTAPDLRIDELVVERDGDTAVVHWDIENTGNVRLTPSAELQITGWLGRTVRTVPAQQLPELLPGANYVGASIVDRLPSMEPLTARLIVTAEGVTTTRTLRFAPYPWLALALVLGLVAVVWWFRRRRRLRRRSTGGPAVSGREKVPLPA